MKIYNSITNKKEEFIPFNDKEINMYVCGPTVYNFCHIGNARPVIFFDVVRRYLTYKGYKVNYASNITDVDDKIIDKAIKEGKKEQEIVAQYAKQYWYDVESIGSQKPTMIPYATSYIASMIKFIKTLVENGFAYEADGDVYFRISKIKEYGILSNQNVDDLEAGARISVEDKKENPLDFALWKKTNEGIKWDSPWGEGRPGWHTECVVMIDDLFHSQIDIHGGGADLKFPHHENEIAQSIACHNHLLARVWMHVGRLEIDNAKMSKSSGRIVLIKDIMQEVSYQVFRLFMLSSHYRQPINYTEEIIEQYQKEWEKINNTLKQANVFVQINDDNTKEYSEEMQEFERCMDDDFNTSNALSIISGLLKTINVNLRSSNSVRKQTNTLVCILDILGIKVNLPLLDRETKEDYQKWSIARKNKDFQTADFLRNKLIEKGIL